ncbi:MULTISPECIES: phage baseplate assembly protein V [Pseudomonadaceae]|uniref:Phage baseplate assembly protein V n=1 Tax=Ectopseudomonas oleovorans TaxID=301 RepID=A0A3D9EV90_ECTOL|nr:phage baseplate assembly protein V [Pseudomonas oleovorans]RED07054.1 phage baseplate assembly protein V [Pseudomonas oleovorans]
MTDIAALSRLIENLIRLGTIAEVDHGSLQDKRPSRVRVQSSELLTGWLPWPALRAGTTRDLDPHTLGEQVLVLSPSGQTAQCISITGLFSALIPANGDRAYPHRRTYPDGAVVEYDSEAQRPRHPTRQRRHRSGQTWRHQDRGPYRPPGNRSAA